jgi:hypothetical protein
MSSGKCAGGSHIRKCREAIVVLLRIVKFPGGRYISGTSWKGKLLLMECIACPDKVSGIWRNCLPCRSRSTTSLTARPERLRLRLRRDKSSSKLEQNRRSKQGWRYGSNRLGYRNTVLDPRVQSVLWARVRTFSVLTGFEGQA